jgi:hypothetical protein
MSIAVQDFMREINPRVLCRCNADKLKNHLEENSWFKIWTQQQTGEVKIQSFTQSLSNFTIDEIDKVLACHYGFTEEELDFIINYDIRYRTGLGKAGGEEEEEEIC